MRSETILAGLATVENGVVKAAGTSEGAKKGWEKRKELSDHANEIGTVAKKLTKLSNNEGMGNVHNAAREAHQAAYSAHKKAHDMAKKHEANDDVEHHSKEMHFHKTAVDSHTEYLTNSQ